MARISTSLFSLSTLLRIRTKRGEHREGSGEKSLLRGVTYFRYCLTVLSRFPLVPLVTLVHIQNKNNCFDSARTKFGYFKNRDYNANTKEVSLKTGSRMNAAKIVLSLWNSWALSIYEKRPEISVVAKVEFPIGKKLFHLVVNPGTWRGARPWTWNWYKLRET